MALQFADSGSDYIEIESFTEPVDSTICCWAYLDEVTSRMRLFGLGDAYEVRIDKSGDQMYPYNDMNKSGTTSSPSTYVPVQEWHHLIFIANRSTGIAYTLLDGVIINYDTGHDENQSGSTFSIARRTDNSYETFHGRIEDFRIYERTLTLGEAQTIYACRGLDSIVDGLFARWPLVGPLGVQDTGVGVVQDIGPNGFHGNIVGSGNDPYYSEGIIQLKRRLA